MVQSCEIKLVKENEKKPDEYWQYSLSVCQMKQNEFV